ncbi:hypothetical protein MKK75_33155 [Methylobacterium sp. J-030]|uniref:hypothetical protein n=1 Tax=Methylobacterium sp. J-030 TaxID=2836627 RepID=UPI001FBA7FAA|nr:hypothetical protein [Methylobacterium sp. J-030]MCJ2073583.1 hypothetical protein [Methylobacterium sp. J-030]
MKIVAANHADSLRRPGEPESAELAILDSVRDELRTLYGELDDAVPLTLAVLAQQVDHATSLRSTLRA